MHHVLIRHKVSDFQKWKVSYDNHAPAREEAGFKELHLLRNADDLNEVVMMFEVADTQKAREFVNSTDLKEAMQKSGVVDQPDIYFLT